MPRLTPQVKRQVESIVAQLCIKRAKEENVPFKRRIEAVNGKKCCGDFEINRFEIIVDAAKFLSLSGEGMLEFAASILSALEEFESRRWEERVRKITRTRSRILKDLAYLRRKFNPEEYARLLRSMGLEVSDSDA